MPAEDLPPHEQESITTEEHYSLDELAKELAEDTLSRGRMLKLAGLALLGGAFGIFGLTKPAEARRRRSSCIPCNTGPPWVYPSGSCCVYNPGSEVGCLVSSSLCMSGSLPGSVQCVCGALG